MSQKIKVGFWTILILITMNCGVVFADASNDFDYVIQNNIPSFINTDYYTEASNSLIGYENLVVISRYYFTFPGSEGDQVTNRIYYTQYYIYGSNNLSYFDKSNNNAIVTPPPVMYLYIEFNHNTGIITFRNYGEKTTKQYFQMQNDSNRKIVFSTKDINYYNSSNIYYPATDTYKTTYYEITLDYKGESSIQANGKKVKAYKYDSIYDTGITTIGNKFLKLGYLYIDDNYTISNLLTSVPNMTKYSMNLINSWQYTLYEGVYTTGEKENGYLKYEIRIPIQYISTPNYYNIFFRSRDTEVQENINIDFVLLNNENSGTIGPIITPSGDIISGDSVKDETTLGDIQNTITEIFQEPSKEEIEEDVKQTVEEIETEIKEKLEKNEIIKALEIAQNGFIEILEGEAGDFKISWEAVNLKYNNKISGDRIEREKQIIQEGEINFSKLARENESIRYVKTTLNTILSALFAMNIAIYLFNTITTIIGGYEDITRERTYNVNKTLKKDKELKTKRGG